MVHGSIRGGSETKYEPADVVEVETYRALCFLALGRSKEAEQSLETLALSRPFHTFDDSDASRGSVRLYQDVRRRAFPEASKTNLSTRTRELR